MRADGVVLDDADWAKVARLRSEGLTLKQIGEHFGVSSTTVRHGLKRKVSRATSAATSGAARNLSNAAKPHGAA